MTSRGRYIAIIGLDGSGKTSIIKDLMASNHFGGLSVKYVWFRFSHLTSFLVLAAGRLIGATRLEKGQMIHRFSDHSVLAFLYPRLLYIDMRISSFFKIRIPLSEGQMVLLDRCPADAIVDLAIDLDDEGFLSSGLARRLYRILPRESGTTVLLDVRPEIVRRRRADLTRDLSLDARYRLYKLLATELSIPTVSNEGNIAFAIAEISNHSRGTKL